MKREQDGSCSGKFVNLKIADRLFQFGQRGTGDGDAAHADTAAPPHLDGTPAIP